MIKWDWFWKLLKLSFFGLLTSFFTLFVGSSVSAVFNVSSFQVAGLSSVPSQLNNQYEITFLKWGWLLTNLLWYWRNIFALDSNLLFFWTPSGYPYFLWGSSYQWYFKYASSCSSLTSGGNYVTPSDCSSFDIWGGAWTSVFKSFFSKVYAGDIVYYEGYSWWRPYWVDRFTLCFNSEELNRSLCFNFSASYLEEWPSAWSSNFSWTLNLSVDTTFSNLPWKYLWYAPGQNGYMGDYEGSSQWSSEVINNTSITWDYVYTVCSNWYVKNYFESQGLSKFACYVWLDINNTGLQLAVAWTGSSVFELFQATNWGNNFSDWFTYWDTQYWNRLVLSSGAWSSNIWLYPYFQFVNEYAWQFTSSDIQDYCRIVVNDLPLTWKRSWNFKYCSSINSSLWVPAGAPGEIPVWVNWWTWTENVDTITFIQNWFNKAKEVIPTDFSNIWGGVLPTYILMFLIALMLFRFISH